MFMLSGCSGVCGFNEFMRKRLIKEKFGDLSAQHIGRAAGDRSADVVAGKHGTRDCSNGENEYDFTIIQSSLLDKK